MPDKMTSHFCNLILENIPVAIVTMDADYNIAWVGDSRAYRLRDGSLEQLTPDHSLVAELERRGMITPEEAQVHPRRNEVLRSIGVEPEVEVDVAQVDARPGDQYLLCSDGLHGYLEDADVLTQVAKLSAAERASRDADLRAGTMAD